MIPTAIANGAGASAAPGAGKFGFNDAMRLAQMAKGGQRQQPPQMAPVRPPFPQQPVESNEEIMKRHMRMVDPVTYQLLYGGM